MIQIATSILGPAATMVIVFGFIYGEFFGNVFGDAHAGLDPGRSASDRCSCPSTESNRSQTFMFLAIGVGVIQVHARAGARRHQRRQAPRTSTTCTRRAASSPSSSAIADRGRLHDHRVAVRLLGHLGPDALRARSRSRGSSSRSGRRRHGRDRDARGVHRHGELHPNHGRRPGGRHLRRGHQRDRRRDGAESRRCWCSRCSSPSCSTR